MEVNDFKITEKRRNVWEIEKELLLELDKVCKKHNLKYFADSGTLLGAVRHKGFIPWDDDIDVVMLREDYDKLINEYSNEFKGKFFLQSAYSDVGYFRGHAQLRNSETTAILRSEGNNVQFNQGIFLDIFPLDFVSKYRIINSLNRKFLNIKLKKFRILYCKEKSNSRIKELIKKIIRKTTNTNNYEKKYRRFEKKCKSIPFKSNCLDKVSFYTSMKQYKYMPLSAYEETIWLDFDDIKIAAPKDYDIILKKMYGKNYMKPIHSNTTHGDVYFNTKHSYKKLLENNKYESEDNLL